MVIAGHCVWQLLSFWSSHLFQIIIVILYSAAIFKAGTISVPPITEKMMYRTAAVFYKEVPRYILFEKQNIQILNKDMLSVLMTMERSRRRLHIMPI